MNGKRSDWKSKLADRARFGSIAGGEEAAPPTFKGVHAKLRGELVVFDDGRYDHHVQEEPDGSRSMYTVETEDGRECYFEVDGEGNLHALICSGLNIEIWQGVLVIGGATYKDASEEDNNSETRNKRFA